MVKRAPYVLTFLALLSATVHAQRDYGREFRSIPTWPDKGMVLGELDGSHVFLSEDGGQMVLAYATAVPSGAGDKGIGNLRVEKFDRNNQVDALVLVDVQRRGSYYTYEYRVSNSAQASQAIRSVSVVATKFADGDTISGPQRWGAAYVASRINAVRYAIGRSEGVFLDWYVNDPHTNVDPDASAIPPGGDLDGFRVTTRGKPGMTLAYVQGGDPPGLRKDMPSAVLEQTVPLMQLEFNSQNVVTVGPKFDADASQREIFRDFYSGIVRMLDAGQIDRSSPAVGRALAVLQACLQAGAIVKTGSSMGCDLEATLGAHAQAGVEAGVLNAMRLSLAE